MKTTPPMQKVWAGTSPKSRMYSPSCELEHVIKEIGMSRKNYEYFSQSCLHGKKPACTCACPLNLNVRKIIEKLQKGNYTAAYRLYRNQALFPAIVCNICDEPCNDACVRKDVDASIALRMLEKVCVDFTRSNEPTRYNLPKNNKKIAVIGAGLAGLSCALKMAEKGYDITVYEQSGRIGGRLWELLSPDIFLPEFELQFKNLQYTLRLNTKIISLDEIEYDAVFIATGQDGNDFGVREGMNAESLGTAKPGVFLGRNLLGTTPVQDIALGTLAAYSIEKYIKVGMMDGIPETFPCTESQIVMNLSGIKSQKAVLATDNETYDKKQAETEAQRCLKCDCTACKDGCELFDFYSQMPKRLADESIVSLQDSNSVSGRSSIRAIASCSQCGLCKEVCPQNINMGSLYSDFMHYMYEDGRIPPAFHDFFIRDMQFSNSEAYLIHPAPGHDRATHLFFPGCQLGASDPQYVESTYAYLLDKMPDTAILVGCCGVPADWAGNDSLHASVIGQLRSDWEKLGEPIVIFACPTCKNQFAKHITEAKGVSLYDIIIAQGVPEGIKKLNHAACVFDPCSSRYDSLMQQSVREIALKSGVVLEELPYSKNNAQCCSWGGHIAQANPELADIIVQNRISAYDNPYITYCTNCRDIFAQRGKVCVHILDIVFDIDKETYSPPSLGQRRDNRLDLKKKLLKKVWNINMDENENQTCNIKVTISDELVGKMDHLLILEEDVCRTIAYCESTGNRMLDPEKGCFIGHLQIGIITYWVEYTREEFGYRLINVYSHRMEIIEY